MSEKDIKMYHTPKRLSSHVRPWSYLIIVELIAILFLMLDGGGARLISQEVCRSSEPYKIRGHSFASIS